MKEIPLSQGKVALVDDEDFERISRYRWHARRIARLWYAGRQEAGRIVSMHNEITSMLGVGHVNGDGLDNRRCNLRLATQAQNGANRKLNANSVSGIRGVSWETSIQKWSADIGHNGRLIRLGKFPDKITAAHVRRQAELAYFGEFAPQ